MEDGTGVRPVWESLFTFLPETNPQKSVSFTIFDEVILTVNSFVCLISSNECLCLYKEIPIVSGIELTIPIQTTVRILAFSCVPLTTNAAGTGKNVSEGPIAFLFIPLLYKIVHLQIQFHTGTRRWTKSV